MKYMGMTWDDSEWQIDGSEFGCRRFRGCPENSWPMLLAKGLRHLFIPTVRFHSLYVMDVLIEYD